MVKQGRGKMVKRGRGILSREQLLLTWSLSHVFETLPEGRGGNLVGWLGNWKLKADR